MESRYGSKKIAYTLLSFSFIALLTLGNSVAQASASSPANGSFIDTSVVSSLTTFSGGSEIIYQTNAGSINGTFTGSYLTFVNLTISATGITYNAIDVCSCTVNGESGTLVFDEVGTLTLINGVYYLNSVATVIQATGRLAHLQATITLQGIVYTQTGLTEGTYSGIVFT
ncbi:MAG: hypothetical protein JRN20_11725 [Nitrososphaerota archaeon]|nr:hypothetical protein [Nitrososphaerota archaeon]